MEQLKFILLGEKSVGKTSLIHKLDMKGIENIAPTTQVDAKVIVNGATNMILYDTPGDEKSIKEKFKEYLRESDAALILYDVTNKKSFDNVEKWIRIFRENNKYDIIILIGNIKDNNGKKVVDENTAKEKCKNDKIEWGEEIDITKIEQDDLNQKFSDFVKIIKEKRKSGCRCW